jgi:hypothetical protein
VYRLFFARPKNIYFKPPKSLLNWPIKMLKPNVRFLCAAFFVLVLQGCANLPSTEVMKAEIVNFQLPQQPAPSKSIVYVVRPSGLGALVRFNIHVDGKEDAAEVGYTRGGQYIYFALTAGEHKIYSNAENWAELSLTAKAGEIIYLQQEPTFGIIMARNNIFRIDDTQGKYYVKTLELGELIKPGGISAASPTSSDPPSGAAQKSK